MSAVTSTVVTVVILETEDGEEIELRPLFAALVDAANVAAALNDRHADALRVMGVRRAYVGQRRVVDPTPTRNGGAS